ncbi:SusC/RagA family TonB-linked outer membrane protein [Mucilaginibacter sp. CAU 1740]|uniref:SusC/RagA family TonB-linked outer membrane protein n=1 Tax=Mucilaginibacter sp. CAU 1740 TaxID=3140365 RepID=UPI00325B0308
MKKLYMLVVFLACCIMYASAQEITVKGTVTDSQNLPLPGVNVRLTGTSKGTTTDVNGKFSLAVSGNGTLTFSYIGYISQTVNIGGKTLVNVTLANDSKMLEMVTVTALGIEQKTKTLSYATQNVGGAELEKAKDPNFVNSLAGKAAGLVITKGTGGVGSASRIELRGAKSIGGNSAPLYVIDGIPIGQGAGGTNAGLGDGSGIDPLSNLNPDDIESIQVLKGASAAALYGSAAANGALLIVTKKGKAGATRIDFNSTTTFDTPIGLPEPQTEYGRTTQGANDMWGAKSKGASNAFIKNFFNTGTNYINGVSLSSGNETAQFYASYANTKAKGIVPNNTLLKHNFTLRGTGKFLDNKLTLDGSVNYIYQKQENPPRAGLTFSPMFGLYQFPTDDDFSKYDKNNFEKYDATRGIYEQNWPYEKNEFSSNQNPYWIVYRDLQERFSSRYISSFKAKYDFAKWISLQARTTLDGYNSRTENKNYATTDPLAQSSQQSINGSYYTNQGYGTHLYSDLLLLINTKVTRDFSLEATLGATDDRTFDYNTELQSTNNYGLSLANYFSANNYDLTHPLAVAEHEYKGLTQSVLGTATIGYKETLFLNATARNEWSYTTPKSFFYPSVGLSYVLTNTIGKSEILSYAKLRASYANVGKAPGMGDNNSNPPYSLNNIQNIVGANAIGQLPFFSGNVVTNIKPERTKTFEVGGQFTLLNNLNIDLAYYDARTSDQIITIAAPSGAGAQSFILNGGEIRNYGFEGSVSYNASFGDLKWTPALNFSRNINQVRALSPLFTADRYVISSSDNTRLVATYLTRPKDGKYGAFGDYYGRSILKNADGSVKVDDKGLPVLSDANSTYVGNPNPKFLAGFNNTFRYKNINFSFLVDSRFGGQTFSMTQTWFDYKGISQRTADARNAGGVKVNGKTVDAKDYYARISGGADGGAVPEYTYSATNIRLRELSLGYTFPFTNKTVKNVSIAVNGRNMFFFYKKAPYDPEQAISSSTNTMGIDGFGVPATRSFGFSVKASL